MDQNILIGAQKVGLNGLFDLHTYKTQNVTKIKIGPCMSRNTENVS